MEAEATPPRHSTRTILAPIQQRRREMCRTAMQAHSSRKAYERTMVALQTPQAQSLSTMLIWLRWRASFLSWLLVALSIMEGEALMHQICHDSLSSMRVQLRHIWPLTQSMSCHSTVMHKIGGLKERRVSKRATLIHVVGRASDSTPLKSSQLDSLVTQQPTSIRYLRMSHQRQRRLSLTSRISQAQAYQHRTNRSS